MANRKILIIGFSVTVQAEGYIDVLVGSRKDLDVSIYAIGGANWHALLYLLDDIKFSNFDVCLFEINTCSRWLAGDRQRYFLILKHIVGRVAGLGVKIGFLNFPRRDILDFEFKFDIGQGYVMDDYLMEKKLL